MEKKLHKKIDMKKNKRYRLREGKYLVAHLWKFNCDCGLQVTNLLGGKRVWTRIRFDCGEIQKINCHCLEKI